MSCAALKVSLEEYDRIWQDVSQSAVLQTKSAEQYIRLQEGSVSQPNANQTICFARNTNVVRGIFQLGEPTKSCSLQSKVSPNRKLLATRLPSLRLKSQAILGSIRKSLHSLGPLPHIYQPPDIGHTAIP